MICQIVLFFQTDKDLIELLKNHTEKRHKIYHFVPLLFKISAKQNKFDTDTNPLRFVITYASEMITIRFSISSFSKVQTSA